MALTPKQEHFCRLVASGKDYTTAYLTAYNWKGGKSGAAIEAIKLINKEDIQAKIQSLIRPMEIAVAKDSINARKSQIDAIEKRIEICIEKEDENSLIRYYDMLNKIYALYKETEQAEKNDNQLSNVDTSRLFKLVSNE